MISGRLFNRRTLLVMFHEHRSWHTVTRLVQVADGSFQELESGYRYYPGWIGSGNLLRHVYSEDNAEISYAVVTPGGGIVNEGSLPKHMDYFAVSPDGKRLAGYVPDRHPDCASSQSLQRPDIGVRQGTLEPQRGLVRGRPRGERLGRNHPLSDGPARRAR